MRVARKKRFIIFFILDFPDRTDPGSKHSHGFYLGKAMLWSIERLPDDEKNEIKEFKGLDALREAFFYRKGSEALLSEELLRETTVLFNPHLTARQCFLDAQQYCKDCSRLIITGAITVAGYKSILFVAESLTVQTDSKCKRRATYIEASRPLHKSNTKAPRIVRVEGYYQTWQLYSSYLVRVKG